MNLKMIACEVFVREICHAVARSPHVVDIEFTPKAAHDQSDFLRNLLQTKIDEAENSERDYEAILLGFGLCGNSTLGLKSSRIPLIIPRAHDCCTIFLGSREKFKEHFGDRLSSEWTSVGYMERGDSFFREMELEDTLGRHSSYQELVEQYGEENAKYVWETLHPDLGEDKIVYIEIPEFKYLGYVEKIKEEAEKEDKELEILEGDIRLIENLVAGNWPEEDFLRVPPGHEIQAVYDHKKVLTV